MYYLTNCTDGETWDSEVLWLSDPSFVVSSKYAAWAYTLNFYELLQSTDLVNGYGKCQYISLEYLFFCQNAIFQKYVHS